jgi:sporulation protein YlmC with PRC-barrel domain
MSYANDPMDQLLEGMAVLDSDGERVGEVGDIHFAVQSDNILEQTVSEQKGYFELKRGSAGADLYIPAEGIQEVTQDSVTLSFRAAEVEGRGYDRPPGRPADEEGELLP